MVILLVFTRGELPALDKKPNILFFYIDDLGWKDLSSYGSDFYETPAIDDLANQGIRFTSAYQAAARCVPSRESLFTGKYHERPGVSDSEGLTLGEYTFAEAFKDAGYHTFFTGKWHLGKDSTRYPDQQGFDINMGGCEWGAPSGNTAGGGKYFSPYDCPTLTDGPQGEYLTDRLTRETVDFLDDHHSTHGDSPFLACVFHYAVHGPIEAPESYAAPYREKLAGMDYDLPEWEVDAPAKTKLRHDHPVYAGMIAAVDESVRKIREKLDELGMAENTIIIFSTDHGGLSTTLKSSGREISTSNYPLRTGKGWIYEGGIRSPLIIYWPNVTKAGAVTDKVVTGLDFYPTMLEMAGLSFLPDQHLDGVSFAPLLKGEDWKREKPMMWYFPKAKTGTGNPNMAAVRLDDHKLIHFMLQDRFELYDLEKDIMESHNLVNEKPELTDQLKNLLFTLESESNMPDVSSGRLEVEEKEILPEYLLSIPESQYPVMELSSFLHQPWNNSFKFDLSIIDDNVIVQPVDVFYYYQYVNDSQWTEITSISGKQRRLLPGDFENYWNYAGLDGGVVNIKIKALVNNELYPIEIAEEILENITIKESNDDIPVPEGRRLRDIVEDRYGPGRLMIGGTTGSWAFDESNSIVMDREFSYVTPENDFKQTVIRKDITGWNWSPADAWLQHIIDNQQVLRIHGPIGPQCSKWVKEDSRTAEELSVELNTFLTALCQRYNNVKNIEYMDVVNETVTRKGDWMGPSPGVDSWENPWTTIGYETGIPAAYPSLDSVPLYIIQAFEIANEYASDLKLVLNQHGGMEKSMWDRIKDLILYLRNEKGFRIDALGWQAHIETGWELENDNISKLEALIDWCQSNDLEFHITEFDSWILDREKHNFEDQAASYEAIIKTMIDKSIHGKIGWNTWHISDAKGWQIERVPALFDTVYGPKPAYYAVQAALEKGGGETSTNPEPGENITGKGKTNRVALFPNPAKQSIKLESSEGIGSINIYDFAGRKVIIEKGLNCQRHEIIIAALNQGYYLVEITHTNGDTTSYLKMQKLN